MTIYEHEDDLNLVPSDNDFTSNANGNSGIPIACCNIQRMPFNWFNAQTADPNVPDFDIPDLTREGGRGLADFDDEDFRKLFDYELDEEEGEY